MGGNILQGDALETLKTLPSASVQCCVTSPPYYLARDYQVEGQIGMEGSLDEYIERLVLVFREVWRVLRDDGTLWVNIGDSYAMVRQSKTMQMNNPEFARTSRERVALPKRGLRNIGGAKRKDLLGVPWLLAFAMRDDGWYLRSEVIWEKSNPLPESVRDRPSKSHEQLFLFAKQEQYYYDCDAIREITGANKRTIWRMAVSNYKDAHFAVMPDNLVEPCVLASSSHRACEICGAGWRRVTEHTKMEVRAGPKRGMYGSRITDGLSGTMTEPARTITTGYEPGCTCPGSEGKGRCVVLDPFSGSGTVLAIAQRLGRDSIGIDLNPEYVEMARKRLEEVQEGCH